MHFEALRVSVVRTLGFGFAVSSFALSRFVASGFRCLQRKRFMVSAVGSVGLI